MNLTNLTPKGPRVLVRRLDEQKLTSNLIEVVHLEEGSPSMFALVLATGKVDPQIEVGKRVITKPFSGAPVKVTLGVDTIEAHIVMEDDILATEN